MGVGNWELGVETEPLVNLNEIAEIELFIIKRMKEFTLGDHASVFKGSGFNFVGVRDWEPRLATVGEDHTDEIAAHARDALVPGGHLVLEVADARAGEVAELLAGCGYEDVLVTEDLAGRDRIVEGRRP